MTKILWFSRHQMTEDQIKDLKRIYDDDIAINQINKTISHVSEIKEEIDNADVIAIVASIQLQQEFLQAAGGKPVISCKNKRIVDTDDNTKVTFVFDGWYRIVKIEVVTEDL